jgi:hypothetical protein
MLSPISPLADIRVAEPTNGLAGPWSN